MILFLIFLNLLLPLIGYGIAGFSSMVFMLVIVAIVDYVAVCEIIKSMKANKQFGRNANHYLFADEDK
jgi:hypothetical protein